MELDLTVSETGAGKSAVHWVSMVMEQVMGQVPDLHASFDLDDPALRGSYCDVVLPKPRI